jgi:hypothetical protein
MATLGGTPGANKSVASEIGEEGGRLGTLGGLHGLSALARYFWEDIFLL